MKMVEEYYGNQMDVSDMDGTLLDENNEIMPEIYEKLMECQKKGIQLIINSGRPVSRIETYIKKL